MYMNGHDLVNECKWVTAKIIKWLKLLIFPRAGAKCQWMSSEILLFDSPYLRDRTNKTQLDRSDGALTNSTPR